MPSGGLHPFHSRIRPPSPLILCDGNRTPDHELVASCSWFLASAFFVHHSAFALFLRLASCFRLLAAAFPVYPSSFRVHRLCVAPARHRRATDPAYRGDGDQNGRFSFRISNIVGSFDVPPTENALGGSTLSTLEFDRPSPGFFAMVNRTPDRELPASLTIPKIPSLTV